MDYAASHVVYVDSRVTRGLDGKHIQQSLTGSLDGANTNQEGSWEDRNPECLKSILGEIEEVRSSLKNILSVFHGVHTCASGTSCMERVNTIEGQKDNDQPMLVIVGTPAEDDSESSSSRSREASHASDSTDIYGQSLLQYICAEVSNSNLSRRIVPVAMTYNTEDDSIPGIGPNKPASRPSSGNFSLKFAKPNSSSPRRPVEKKGAPDPRRVLKCVDLGALEVLPSPIPEDRLQCLVVHAYRAHREALRERAEYIQKKKMRKLSWLGNNDKRPYAYLREKMVSELMTGICNPDQLLDNIDHKRLPNLDPIREAQIKHTIGTWNYSGHEYSDDETIYSACFMLQHALTLPELERWRIPEHELKLFLMASRAAYNSFVNYHNFRHVIDVMQAIFFFLIQIGILPPFPDYSASTTLEKDVSPIAALLKPFDALTLLITAIGHDVGHPGVNNAFLVSLNAPLAQLYNDKSVLEAFHCAAYSQILRRYWPATFKDIPMRGLMINSILATDMGVHMKYMSDLGNLQAKLHHNQGTEGWSVQILDEYRVLTCALLVKCADISNVARPFNIALKWADSLQLEFANQGVMEQEVGIATTLFGGPPELGNLIKLGNSQNSFMNIFARPLFESVTDILPAMEFAVHEMKANQSIWTNRIKKAEQEEKSRGRQPSEGWQSPRSMSPKSPNSQASGQPEASHPEGLPASNSPSQGPGTVPFAATKDSPEGRRKSSSSATHHLTTIHSLDGSRRSSSGQHFGHVSSTPGSAASFSRRSSGALSASNIQQSVITARRMSNTSPSQLQLGAESRSQTNSSVTTAENQHPNGHASDDTLSQSQFYDAVTTNGGDRRSSATSIGGGDHHRMGSKASGSDNMRSVQSSTSQASGQPYAHSGRHRSSSGAHTTNTNLSQSTPYSPTGTQATSVLTVDSDGNTSQSRMDSCGSPESRGMPSTTNGGPRFGALNGIDGTHETYVKTTVLQNGSVKEGSSNGYRSIGRKGSRFNFSNIFKKRKGIEASP